MGRTTVTVTVALISLTALGALAILDLTRGIEGGGRGPAGVVFVRNALIVLTALGALAILGWTRRIVGGGRGPAKVVLGTSHALAILDSALLADEGFFIVLILDPAVASKLGLGIQAV